MEIQKSESIKNVYLTFRINELVKEEVRKQAEAAGLSLSAYINRLAIRDLQRKGIELTVVEKKKLV